MGCGTGAQSVYGGRVRGGRDLFLYGTLDGQKAPNPQSSGIGVARVKEGRFTGMQAGDRRGYLLTRELMVTGSVLEVNFEPRTPSGCLTVRLLQRDPSAKPDLSASVIAGMDFEDCVSVTEDATRATVQWRGRNGLSDLKGQAVYAHLHVSDGTVYGVRFPTSMG